MSFINHLTKELNCKIVYVGPGLGGKTTNIQYVYQKTAQHLKGKMVSLDTENERTLFFDFLPLDLGEIRGLKTRLHLYTVPGQAFYEAGRRLILKGLDGIIFVADSQIERMDANMSSLEELEFDLNAMGVRLDQTPFVMQWNKRDLPNIAPIKDLKQNLNKWDFPEFEAKAIKGEGVFESLKMLTKMILLNIKGGLE